MDSIIDPSSGVPGQTASLFESALDRSRGPGGKNGQDQADPLKRATEEFEAMFLSYLLKVMRSTVETPTTEDSSIGKDIYADLFDNEIALSIARTRSLGIGDMMYQQLKDREGAGISRTDTPVAAPQNPTSIPAAIEQPAAESRERMPPSSLPVDGYVSSSYGRRADPFSGALRFHKGIDIAAPVGTPFHAVSGGTVVFSGVLGTYGNTIIVESPNGDRSLYAHASHLMISAGETVSEDQVIGLVGSTGRSTGPHLHFEAQVKGESVDPRALLAAGKLTKGSQFEDFQ